MPSRNGRTSVSDPTTALAEQRHDEQVKGIVEDDSDELLRTIDEIRELESQKREVPMSTPEFHEKADLIERKARVVFGLAKAQREVGEALSGPQEDSIDDVAAKEDGNA